VASGCPLVETIFTSTLYSPAGNWPKGWMTREQGLKFVGCLPTSTTVIVILLPDIDIVFSRASVSHLGTAASRTSGGTSILTDSSAFGVAAMRGTLPPFQLVGACVLRLRFPRPQSISIHLHFAPSYP